MSKWLLDDNGTIEKLKSMDLELVKSEPDLICDSEKMACSDDKNRKLLEVAASYLVKIEADK